MSNPKIYTTAFIREVEAVVGKKFMYITLQDIENKTPVKASDELLEKHRKIKEEILGGLR